MSKSRLGPEAKIISLFTALPDDSKRIVLDIIKAQSAAPRKAPKQKAASQPAAKESTPDKKATGPCAKVVGDHTCGLPYDNPLHHDNVYADYHPFEPAKPVARASRKSKAKSEGANTTPSIEAGTESVLAASSGGD